MSGRPLAEHLSEASQGVGNSATQSGLEAVPPNRAPCTPSGYPRLEDQVNGNAHKRRESGYRVLHL